MAATKHSFATLLRQLDRPDWLAPLAAALGFTPLPPRSEGRSGLTAAEETLVPAGLGRVRWVGNRDNIRLLHIEHPGQLPLRLLSRYARALRDHDLSRPSLLLATDQGRRFLHLAVLGLEGELRHLSIDRRDIRPSDLETLEEMVPAPGDHGLAMVLRCTRALDRSRLTRRFFADFTTQRAAVARGWRGIGANLTTEREQLALLFLCRLMFVYFLQRQGHLGGDREYLARRFRRWQRERSGREAASAGVEGGRQAGGRTFFRTVIVTLFWEVLDRRPEVRRPTTQAFGDVPYLNGGLFQRHALERRFRRLDLPDEVMTPVFDDLLERYRFTARERAEDLLDGTGGRDIDPEMLGRVFEGLMAAERRGDTGTFYTPAPVVDRLVASALSAHLAAHCDLGLTVAGAVVHGEVAPTLDARQRAALKERLSDLLILDPACGSGAFLLGVLSRVVRIRAALGDEDPAALRREIVGRCLHGVDIQDDAALLCALRLWLTLTVEGPARARVDPLPNLDRRVRQGDALLDPLDLGDGITARTGFGEGEIRHAVRLLQPTARRYVSAEPAERAVLRRRLRRQEARLARAWLDAARERLSWRLAEARADAAEVDLWGAPTARARGARSKSARLRQRVSELARTRLSLEQSGALPFFSFAVHFVDAAARGFDLILSNPPWVRAHRWPGAVQRMARRRYLVCREAGWRYAARVVGAPAAAGGQVDLSLLFLERSLRLLAPGGTLGMLLPAKALRSLYGSAARRLLLSQTRVVAIEDAGLNQRALFHADSFAAFVVAQAHLEATGSDPSGTGADAPIGDGPAMGANLSTAVSYAGAKAAGDHAVAVTLMHRKVAPLQFHIRQRDLSLRAGDPSAPWLLVPPDVRRAIRRMQEAASPLGERDDLRVRRGIMTGANEVLVVREWEHKLGDLTVIRAEGFFSRRTAARERSSSRYQAVVESGTLRPLLRGADIRAWRGQPSRRVIWVHDAELQAREPPRRLAAYLARHRSRLERRTGFRRDASPGALARLSRETLLPKVAWHDLAETVKAVALPGAEGATGSTSGPGGPIPLNTVYFIPTTRYDRALLLAAYLNSTALRTFARAIAERAKDARFRFFAWTIAILPLPADWDRGPRAERMLSLSTDAHAAGSLAPGERAELDDLVARCYGLSSADRRSLEGFDRWLRGEAPRSGGSP